MTKPYRPFLGLFSGIWLDGFVNNRTTTLNPQGQKPMADRRVKKSGKNKDGDITKLCNAGESWSPRTKADAISDIEKGTHRYYVSEAGFETTVTVVSSNGTKFLRTVADKSSKNNLDNLPDC
jgi:hypothetical protein